MYVCLDCRHLFTTPYRWEEKHGFDYGPFEQWSGCPRCKEPYTEAHQCDCCNEWINGPYIRIDNGKRICENCYRVMDLGDEE